MKRNLLRFVLLSVMGLFTLGVSAQATPDKDYLCLTAKTALTKVILRSRSNPTAVTIEYSTDGTNWNDYTIGRPIGLDNVDDKVYFRNAEPASNVTGFSKDATNFYQITVSGSATASGNVMSLVDKNCETTEIPCEYCFYKLFSSDDGLTSAPELPATKLRQHCYDSMFDGCKGLTSAPELPATTLANCCYYYMFIGCTSLTTAPELPATELAIQCYAYMFQNCTSLTTAPELPATTLVSQCYYNMFNNCSSLNDMKVAFTAFGRSAETGGWATSVTKTGTFTCPEGLEQNFGSNYIPLSNSYKWTIKNTYDLAINSETGWASMCVNLPLEVPTGVEVYYASAVEGSTITLTQIPANTVMAAKTAVIVKKPAEGTTVSFPIAIKDATITPYTDNLFQGSSVAKACNAGENYVLNASKSSDTNVHFSIYTGTTLTDHKAYLPKSAVGGASSIQFRFGDATAISTVEMESNDDVLYNMAGQRVSDDYRGIVIKNGKKTWNN